MTVEYDSFRNCFVSMIVYNSIGVFSYIIHVSGLRVGDFVCSFFSFSTNNVRRLKGSSCFLGNIEPGTYVSNVEIYPGSGAVFARSAGVRSKLLKGMRRKKNEKYVLIRLPSKQVISLSYYCFATIGVVSNFKFFFKKMLKAGSKRHLGICPIVRGVAMNPNDHPHGGGEGKKSKLVSSKSV